MVGAGFPAVAATPPAGLSWGESLYDRLLAQRIVFLGQEVNDEIGNKICAQMLLLAAEDPTADISLYINSPGGSISSGMAIFDTMRLISCDVATYAMGMAASMGQFLLSAGTPGKRYALPNAEILMHQPLGGVGGSVSDINIQAERLRRLKKRMAELIAEFSGQTPEQIREDSERDRWFSAAEAKEYGLVDHVITRSSETTESNPINPAH
ncbi:ATP-dependent Clp protease proteolytic subunit [Nocardia transvalensis]|uniref:ATP-dependent Clp protease proteolytic subunit n=1 Tax=Nocardia transvalensis TaxID=37333 RepID=UPI0018952C33|nr:ATP-dependent Clp protease proteolytic subunit [Nocardia transvalensis]MBF6332803.1 ATP-dependent Clp protease proteolytic subunit [Nocardia transvalensis]